MIRREKPRFYTHPTTHKERKKIRPYIKFPISTGQATEKFLNFLFHNCGMSLEEWEQKAGLPEFLDDNEISAAFDNNKAYFDLFVYLYKNAGEKVKFKTLLKQSKEHYGTLEYMLSKFARWGMIKIYKRPYQYYWIVINKKEEIPQEFIIAADTYARKS